MHIRQNPFKHILACIINPFVHNTDMNPILHIRKNVFRLKQRDFADVVGVQQSTISRWERGESFPTLNEMHSIRAAARERGKRWQDRWFFEPPSPATNAEDAA